MDDDKLDKVDGKLDEISNNVHQVTTSIARLEVYVARNTDDLTEHMKRTELNEDRIMRLEKVEQWLRGAIWITMGLVSLVFAVVKLFQ